MVEVKLRIITEVRQHPVIYDKAHKSHFKKMSKLLFLIVKFNCKMYFYCMLLNQEFPQYEHLEIDGEFYFSLYLLSMTQNVW